MSDIERKRRNIANALNNPGCMRRYSPLYYIDAETGEKREISFTTDKNYRGGHTAFENKQDGLIAMSIVLREKFDNKNLTDIMKVYAPEFENDTNTYIKTLKKRLKEKLGPDFNPDEPLDLNNPVILKELMMQIARYEGALVGVDYTEEMFDYAVRCQTTGYQERGQTLEVGSVRRPPEMPTNRTPDYERHTRRAEERRKKGCNKGIVIRRAEEPKLTKEYPEEDLTAMRQTVSNLVAEGLLTEEEAGKNGEDILKRLCAVRKKGKEDIFVDGKKKKVEEYVAGEDGVKPERAEEMLKKGRELKKEEKEQLASTLRRAKKAVSKEGTVQDVKTSTPKKAGKNAINHSVNDEKVKTVPETHNNGGVSKVLKDGENGGKEGNSGGSVRIGNTR